MESAVKTKPADWFNDDDLLALILEYGVKNIRFFLPMRPIHSLAGFGIPMGFTSSSDEEIMSVCEIVEDRYKVADGYKITVRGIEDLDYFCNEHYYQSDLANMMRRNPDTYQIWVLEDDPAVYRRLR